MWVDFGGRLEVDLHVEVLPGSGTRVEHDSTGTGGPQRRMRGQLMRKKEKSIEEGQN